MKLIIDNQIIKLIKAEMFKTPDNLFTEQNNQVTLRWPSLLEYLDLGSIFSQLPEFNQTNPLFQATVTTLHSYVDQDTIFNIYDRLFAENLTLIKVLPQLQSVALLQAIEHQPKLANLEIENALSFSLKHYKTALTLNNRNAMHDLILYLGWDRMCAWISRLFDYQSQDTNFVKGLKILKECLIESFLHISHQDQTPPSFYCLLEALVFYYMREECLQKHSSDEWIILSQSFQLIKQKDELADFFYIDDGIVKKSKTPSESLYLTLESSDKVNARITLAELILGKIKSDFPAWNYEFQQNKIISQ